MNNKFKFASSLSLALFAISAQAASANPTLDDKLALRIGPFFPDIETSIKVGNETQNYEDYLDDSETTGSIKGIWRISDHVRLNFGYWAVNRETSDSLDQNVNIGSAAIPAGTSIGASFDSSLATAALGWSFVNNGTTDFGVDLGIASIGLKSELGATVPGIGNASFTVFDESYLVPTIGTYVSHALSPTWSLAGRLSGIGLNTGDFDGSIVDIMAAVEYRPWQNIGVGLAYVYNDAQADLKEVSGGANVEWNYRGPFLYMTVGFQTAKYSVILDDKIVLKLGSFPTSIETRVKVGFVGNESLFWVEAV